MQQPCRGLIPRSRDSDADCGVQFSPWVLLEEVSSRSEFADRGTAAGHTAYLKYHGVAAGGVAVALMEGFRLVCGAR